jgi:hypothetical protein
MLVRLLVIIELSENNREMIEMIMACSACIGGVDIPYTVLNPAPTSAAETSAVVRKVVFTIVYY